MTDEPKKRFTIEPVPSCDPDIGLLLEMLEESRGRTKERLAGLTEEVLEWTPKPGFNSIGTILHLLALIQADWLYAEALEQAFPPESAALFPGEVCADAGLLTVTRGESL